MSRYYRRRGGRNRNSGLGVNSNQVTQEQWQIASVGLDETLIKSITICKYKRGEGLIQGNDCAVCLSEFQEGESLRLLPKCSHAFHLPCIDTWLKSHSNCPLCRANIVSTNSLPLPSMNSENPSTLNISSLEIQRLNDLIFVIDNQEVHHCEEVVVSLVNDIAPKNNFHVDSSAWYSEMRNNTVAIGQEGNQHLRRSISLGTLPRQRQLLIADILKIDQKKEGLIPMDIGSSKGATGEQSKSNNRRWNMETARGNVAMKRSISTGRFMFTKNEKEKEINCF